MKAVSQKYYCVGRELITETNFYATELHPNMTSPGKGDQPGDLILSILKITANPICVRPVKNRPTLIQRMTRKR